MNTQQKPQANTKHKKKLMILGASGQLGSELCLLLNALDIHTLIPVDKTDLDLRKLDHIEAFILEHQPHHLINCAAYTDCDGAEDNQELAHTLNASCLKPIATACAKLNTPLYHISTDYVFDGKANTPYKPDSEPNPQNIYGKTKLSGEDIIRNQLSQHMIFRTSWLFGRFGKNFVKTMVKLGKEHEELKVVNDQTGCPTSARTLAKVIIRAIQLMDDDLNTQGNIWGTYHVCNHEPTTWFHFAERIFEYAKAADIDLKVNQINPVTTDHFPTKAQRPSYSVMDTTKTSTTFDIQLPDWRDELMWLITEIYS